MADRTNVNQIGPPFDGTIRGTRKLVCKSKDYKQAIFDMLMADYTNGKLRHGAIAELAITVGCSESLIRRIWRRGRSVPLAGTLLEAHPFVDRRSLQRSVLKYQPEVLKAAQRALTVEERGTVRDSAAALGIPKSTYFDYAKKHSFFNQRTIVLKPALSAVHKANRVSFARSKTAPGTNHFCPQYNTLHLDEKWFYVDKIRRKVWLAEGEELPERSVRNKNYIEKVMFLAVVGRPWKRGWHEPADLERDGWYFDGKVGLFPFVETGRISPRGDNAGNPCLKLVNISKEVFEDFLVDKVLVEIAHNCPFEMLDNKIYLQLDNATPHKIDPNGRFLERCNEIGIEVELLYQPSQSPDLNICDLSFFNALQTIYYKKGGIKSKYRLIAAVEEAFAKFEPTKLNYAFLTLFNNYNMIIMNGGSNHYKIPHMGKERLERHGLLPEVIEVTTTTTADVPDMAVLEEDFERLLGEVDDDFETLFSFID